MDKWSVEIYQDPRGRIPVDDYLVALPPKDRARLLRAIDLLEDYGPLLKMPHARHLHGKMWELRVDSRPNSYRILYAAVPGRKFLLLHAFAKKTEKTPAGELATARRRLADYLKEQPNG
jgi:phage-related protein